MQDLIFKLYQIGAIRFGSFELKKDFFSPFQIDLSVVISHPQLAKSICKILWEKVAHFPFDLICGASYVGACFANYLAWEHEKPLLVRRTGIKTVAPKIMGMYKSGQKCLIIQDILFLGSSSLETIDDLQDEGLEVRDLFCFIDLELGGKKKIKGRSFIPHAAISIREILQILSEAGRLRGDLFKLSMDFLDQPK